MGVGRRLGRSAFADWVGLGWRRGDSGAAFVGLIGFHISEVPPDLHGIMLQASLA